MKFIFPLWEVRGVGGTRLRGPTVMVHSTQKSRVIVAEISFSLTNHCVLVGLNENFGQAIV